MVTDAPIDRSVVLSSSKALRLVLGIAFVAYSAASTISYAADDMLNLFHWGLDVTILLVADRYWYGFAFAVIIFFGEIVTNGRSISWYIVFLAPDTFYTARQIQQGIRNALGVLIGPSAGAVAVSIVLSWAIALVVGVLIAKFGEELIFGKAKRTRKVGER